MKKSVRVVRNGDDFLLVKVGKKPQRSETQESNRPRLSLIKLRSNVRGTASSKGETVAVPVQGHKGFVIKCKDGLSRET
jgi:hypothetical protein